MAAAAERQRLGHVWHCYSDYVHCVDAHVLFYHESGYRGNRRHINGPEFLECRTCNPPTQYMALFLAKPSPMAICYALSRESYLYWDKQDELPEIPELLHRLRDPDGNSHNPYWRAPRQRDKR